MDGKLRRGAEAIDGDREKCVAAGMDGYVTKPIDAEALFAAIRMLVVGERSASKSASVQAPAAPVEPEAIPIDVESLLARCMNDAVFAAQTLEKFPVQKMTEAP